MSPDTDQEKQDRLKAALQEETDSAKLERLAAALIGRLLDVGVAVAKSGFQHGADAGTAGRQGRRLRIECKKYGDNTSLSDRELEGEIDEALRRDPALEAWILVSTREVSEQTEQSLFLKGEAIGVPVVILDFKSTSLGALPALCGFAPDLVANVFSPEAEERAKALQRVCDSAVQRIRRDLQAWCLGFDALRARSLARLQNVWQSPRASNAALGQDAAGGACTSMIRRQSVHRALEEWWNGAAREDAPIAVVGSDGVGKTWATLDWLVNTQGELPIVLVVPSSAVVELRGASETALKMLLADRLYELTGARDRDHWLHRLDNLLKRPREEGPVLTVFFDGLNQEPSVPWLSVLKTIQGNSFESKVRVIVSTRSLYYETSLSKLSGLVVPAVVAPVDVYDLTTGGEFDQVLAFEGLTRSDLHPDLIPLARTPRLFRLVVRFRERLVEAGQVTVHRLLWEYGRDTFGTRAGRSFSEAEWRAWLREIARQLRNGIERYTLRSLSETTNRPDLSQVQVYARLSDIVDGRFVTGSTGADYQLTPVVVAHALGAALLTTLDAVTPPTFESINGELGRWLDPIAGLDQRAEILRAAVSILVEQGGAQASKVAGVLVTAWLQTQNVSDAHRRELRGLAAHLTEALLDAVEQSSEPTHASARVWAVNTLRTIDRKNESAFLIIVKRARSWYSVVSRGLDAPEHRDEERERRRSQRFIERVGIDASGPLRVLGVELTFIDRDVDDTAAAVASLLQGFPLAGAVPAFEAAAVALVVAGRLGGWDSLNWLCLMNEIDPDETASALRAAADATRRRAPEPGIHPGLPARAASLLLWLTGQERDETAAVQLDPRLDSWPSYEEDYLPQPGRSFFPLERRHALQVLNDKTLQFLLRADRCRELWLDPTFEPPSAFIAEARDFAQGIDVEKLDRHSGMTVEEHQFSMVEPVLARCAPDLLASIARQKVYSYRTCPAASRYWAAIHATAQLVLVGDAEREAARALRLSNREQDEGREWFAASKLLFLELHDLEAAQQADSILHSEVTNVLLDFERILKPLSTDGAEALVNRFKRGPAAQQRLLVILLSVQGTQFGDATWRWLSELASGADSELQGLACRALTKSDAARFGRELFARDWSWSSEKDFWVNHYGSGALIEASIGIPFDQVVPRVGPWRVLEAARKRGSDPSEVRLAATVFGRVLATSDLKVPDPGSQLSIDRSAKESESFLVSVMPESSDQRLTDPAAIKAAFDVEAQVKAYRRAAQVAESRIRDARRSGASLYLTNIAAEDFKPALAHASDIVDTWLEGCGEGNSEFDRRVGLAEGAYLALSEALLIHNPSRGATVWQSTRRALRTHYIGKAGVDEMVHILFRGPDSPETVKLRDELVGLDQCHTDQDLLNVAIAADYNGKSEWLSSVIERDKTSPLAWRRRRSLVLGGFRSHAVLPVPEAWPDGEIRTSHDELRRWCARFRYRAACARHWWRAYLAADNPDTAYAAWILLLHSADRRAWVWMSNEAVLTSDDSAFCRRKINHVELNLSKLRRAMEEQEREMNRKFLNRRIAEELAPWNGSEP
jgi:hypothetical protein